MRSFDLRPARQFSTGAPSYARRLSSGDDARNGRCQRIEATGR
jgi:hypothetical protein